jgi:hypothetical protein
MKSKEFPLFRENLIFHIRICGNLLYWHANCNSKKTRGLKRAFECFLRNFYSEHLGKAIKARYDVLEIF